MALISSRKIKLPGERTYAIGQHFYGPESNNRDERKFWDVQIELTAKRCSDRTLFKMAMEDMELGSDPGNSNKPMEVVRSSTG